MTARKRLTAAEREQAADAFRKRLAMIRHRDAALRALDAGYDVQRAADITGLPIRFVARVAAASGITEAHDWARPPTWATSVLNPAKVQRNALKAVA